ncbi:MAG: hypothetical protein ACTHU0_08180 [Kofleriaceae bacterium]
MLRLALAAGLVATLGCRHSLEDEGGPSPVDAGPISPACMEATTYSNLANIENKIFKQSCVFSGCHNGANTAAGELDLRAGMAHASLVNVASRIDATRKMVVPDQIDQSYLLMMMGRIAPGDMSPPAAPPPDDIGLMPQNSGGALLCVQKLEAIERWILAGAPND